MLKCLGALVFKLIGFCGLALFLFHIVGLPYVFASGYSGGGTGGGGGGGDAVTASGLQQFAATTSTQFLGVITNETGTGVIMGNDTPTILTPTIASFTNAQHTHADAAGGGNITAAALGTAMTPQLAALGLGNAAGASGLIITSALNTCLTVGPNGTTTPTLSIDCSVATAATGVQIVPTASGSGVTLLATGGTNEAITLLGKGSSNANIQTGTGGTVSLRPNGTTRYGLTSTTHTLTTSARTSGSASAWAYTGGADTLLTTATEAKDFLVDLSQTKQHASNGTVALQRHMHFLSGTDTCQTATCTITEDALLALSGPPTGGTNSAVTQSEAFLIETKALTNVTAGFAAVVNAPTGATTNYAAKFTGVNGVLFIPPATQTVAATDTIVADSCGGVKNITADGAVTTNTTNTFTAPAAANTGCSMMVCNVGATNAITLDKNANFLTVGGIDLVLLANSCVGVTQSTGTEWRQTSAQLTAS